MLVALQYEEASCCSI